MLRPSRDWRESITLSSRDPHFGQRIVSEHSVSHNKLWRQCARSIFLRFASAKGTRPTPLPLATRREGLLMQRPLWARQLSSWALPFFLRTRNRPFRFPISDKQNRRVLSWKSITAGDRLFPSYRCSAPAVLQSRA